jgi:hypothetical protein
MSLLMMTMMAGCVTSTTRYYVPTAGADRISTDELREQADAMLPLECPRLLRGREIRYGAADFTVLVDTTGAVQRVYVDRGSGDDRFDDVLGALAAQLRIVRPSARKGKRSESVRAPDGSDLAPIPLTVSYSCATTASSLTVQLRDK